MNRTFYRRAAYVTGALLPAAEAVMYVMRQGNAGADAGLFFKAWFGFAVGCACMWCAALLSRVPRLLSFLFGARS